MKEALFTLFMSLLAVQSLARQATEVADTTVAKPDRPVTDSLSRVVEMQEVVVQADNMTLDGNRLVCLPTAMQRRHSHGGYDLLSRMMIPGMTVSDGGVDTPYGSATLYINGNKASYNEIRMLRSKDIIRVDYHFQPEGKFAADNASVDFIVKTYDYGGYTIVDGSQTLGFLNGSYNVASKYAFKNYTLNLWGGYNANRTRTDMTETESYLMPSTDALVKETASSTRNRSNGAYGIASLSYQGKKSYLSVNAGLNSSVSRGDLLHGSVAYSALFPASEYSQSSRSDNLKPSLSVYYVRNVTDRQRLQVSANAYYSDTDYRYSNTEQESVIDNDVSEDLWYLNADMSYSFIFKDKSALSMSMQEFYKDTKSRYRTTGMFDQRLYTSETLFFVAYNKKLSDKTTFYTSAGLSYQQYRLQGHDVVRHWTPRSYIYASYMPDSRQNLRLSFAFGNSTPTISQLNDAEQQIDRIMVRRGNPGLGKSLMMQSQLTYLLNLKKWSLMAYAQYEYDDNNIANDYFFEGDMLVSTFSDGVRYHQCSNMLAITFMPSQSFNMRLNGGYIYTLLRGQLHDREGTWWTDLYANYYLKDFYFSASYSMATRGLTPNGVKGKNPSGYGLAVGWNRDDLSLELRATNPFVPSHRKKNEMAISSDAYSMNSATTGDSYNQCLTLKVTYTFEYGKKVSRSEKVNVGGGESSILKGKM